MATRVERLRSIVTVEPVIFLYMTGTFLVIPAYQQMVISKTCSNLFGQSSPTCSDLIKHPEEQAEVQSSSSLVFLFYTSVLSLLSVPPALLLGPWSDRQDRTNGGSLISRRRLVLLLPCFLSLASGGLLVAMALINQMGALWILMAAGLVGLSGGTSSLFLSSFSYIADLTASKGGANRTKRMAVAEAMIFVGGAIGFLLGGYLVQQYGPLSAFSSYCCCQFLSIVYILFWLRDPNPPQLVTSTDGTGSFGNEHNITPGILSYTRRSVAVVFRKRAGQERLKLLLLIICTFLNNLVAVGESSVSLLYLSYEPRNFSTELYGIFHSVRMLLLGLVLLLVFPLLLKYISEQTLAKLSALFRTASLITMAFSTNKWMVFLVSVIGAPSGITQAVIRSLCSAIVEPQEQGAMFSFSASVEALCILLSGLLFNGLYPLTLMTVAGMPFIVMATLTLVVFILMQWVSELPATHPCLVLQD
ncbi:proton-coupled folate transporter [Polymixia lowei]